MHIHSSTRGNTFDPVNAAPMKFHDGAEALARSKDDLVRDFQNLINEGEALLKSTTNLSGEALALARESFRAKLTDAKMQVDALSNAAHDGGRQALRAADDYVRTNPWPAVGVAAGLGLLVGAMTLRR
jgi:ElaB/YqjD/DUF883 family membrane-anchored ribosome-binding protein